MEIENAVESSYSAEGVPTLYCNIANVTIAFSDLRLYLGEVTPKSIVVNPEAGGTRTVTNNKIEALVTPRISVVFNPEFAKSVGEAILTAVSRYEAVFGPLRTQKTAEQINAALALDPTP
jgi:hypothetical protein